MAKWTRDDFIQLLATNDKAVGRALVSLLEDQTFDEQQAQDTKYRNGKGFTASDARIMTSMAKQFRDRGFLSPKQINFLRRGKSTRYPSRIGKYAAQLARKVNEKIKQLEFEINELESLWQTEATLAQAAVKRQELNRISPKEKVAQAA